MKKGGKEIQEESMEYARKHGPLKTGEVAVTSAGRLKAKYIIYAVGPRRREPDKGNKDEG